MCPETPDDVRRDMPEYGERPEDHFVLAFLGERLIGAVACDWSESQGRGWIVGPFVAPEHWERASVPLLEKILSHVPGTIRQFDTYTDVANRMAYRLYLSQGFKEHRWAQVYTAKRGETEVGDASPRHLLEREHESQFLSLHQASFPEAPEPGPELLRKRSEDRPIFVAAQGATLWGYLAAHLDPAPPQGYVDYLAVIPEMRGRGLGSRLLGTALAWFFRERGMPQASLCVYETNEGARRIYERAGFALVYTGVSTRRFR
jgi:ribosomal protein S18 acetylase RimI-like enzyme